MRDEPATTTPRRKGRSPSYPAIDLGLAVQRAEQLWAREHHYQTAIPTILSHWGYGAKSGGGFGALAALKSFGLLEDEGSGEQRRAWLSDLGQGIVTAESEDARRLPIRRAALRPKIHHELWSKYGARLPSDQSIELFLMRERNFTPSGASELVSEWKRTMAFATLTHASANLSTDDGDTNAEHVLKSEDGSTMTPPPTIDRERKDPPSDPSPQARPQRAIQVPYSPTEWALVQASFPLSEGEWQQLLAVLQAMKLGLVLSPEEE